ncbi:hypothetical protein F5Y00DRAFT_116510 [Daldinia vernicosa]|uniref:uncharacterized protein n=1 Tax=Daldinia vernicosa TaxID=114800 RepID=UPI0020078F2B|nr:uncharacterized protein F5Y00DRAFT_116510 [Daldinia vernicosa]KAI0847568.1 hypothetical protein F5Y00DRAFT_116510 [Daldinia vernicosa]
MNNPSPSSTMGSDDEISTFRIVKSDGVAIPEDRLQYNKAVSSSEENWLRKLGEMLGSQFYPKSNYKFVLEAFPQNYTLRQKFREAKTTSDATSSDTAVNKGASDCYLYGYPDLGTKGRSKANSKNYRSPAEFFDHLLWLVTDGEDRSKCYCKHCKSYNSSQTKTPTAKAQVPARPGPAAKLPGPLGGNSPAQSATTSTASSPAPSGPSGTSVAPGTSVASAQRVASAALTTQAAISPATVVMPHDKPPLFREGEVVWYILHKSFRLGLVIQNLPSDPTTSTPTMHKIKPLSHSRRALEDVIQPENDMRPFLAYSVPAPHPILDKFSNHPMEAIPWDSLEAQVSKIDEGLSVEASKVGASRVDHSYSLFNPLVDPTLQPNQQSFGGVFLGCEKICTFEAIRVRLEQAEHPQWDNPELPFAMVVRKIVLEGTDKGEELFFHGDLWLLQETDSPAHGDSLRYVTQAMVREKMFRDKVKHALGIHHEWRLIQNPIKKSSAYVRGRFHVSEKLGPLLDQENWAATVQQGHFMPPKHKSLNNRGDSKSFDVGRKESRSDTFAGIFPPGTVLSFGPDVVEQPGNAYHPH